MPPLDLSAQQVAQQTRENVRQSRLMGLIMATLDAELPREEALDYWEPDKLSPKHLQVLIMKAAGFKNRAISEQLQLSESRISVIVNHPDSQQVLAGLVALAADQLTDLNTQLKAYSHEILPSLMQDFRVLANREDVDGIKARASLGFGILDRAGFGPTRKVEGKVQHQMVMPAGEAARLAGVIEEAEEAEYEILDTTVVAGSGAGDAQAVSVPAGASRPPAGSSPAPPSSAEERAA